MAGATTHDDRVIEDIQNRIRALLESEPRGFDQARRRIDRLNNAVREEVVRTMEPMLRAGASALPTVVTYDDKKAFAKWLNAELRRQQLAIRCPKTGHPTLLEVNPGHTPTVGRFRLDYMDEHGRHHTTYTSVELPPLELVADPTVTARGRQRGGRGR